MDKIALAALGLPENATQTDILNKINEIKSAAEAAKVVAAAPAPVAAVPATPAVAENTAMKELEAIKTSRANELVENAVKEGRIKADVKQNFVNLAVNDYELAKNTLAGIPASTTSHQSVMSIVTNNNAPGNGANDKESYEWLAENDPAKLRNILETDPDKYDRIAKEHAKKHQC